jgi:hypothetical protein
MRRHSAPARVLGAHEPKLAERSVGRRADNDVVQEFDAQEWPAAIRSRVSLMPGDRSANASPQPSAARFDPLPVVLIGLTMTTGIVAAISVFGRGGVFKANMTGNVVFLGFALAGIPGYSLLRSTLAPTAFLAGPTAGGFLGTRFSCRSRRRWVLTVAGIEAGPLLLAWGVALRNNRTTHERQSASTR